jgi:hypothetical protein
MTRAFKCDSCGELFEGESPAVARLNVRVDGEFPVADGLRADEDRSVSERVRKLAGDGNRGEDLFMELCLGCARELIPEPEPESEPDPEPDPVEVEPAESEPE